MIYEEKPNGLRVLKASDREHKIGCKGLGCFHDVVYMSKYQTIDDFYEVTIYDEEYLEYLVEQEKINEVYLEQTESEEEE